MTPKENAEYTVKMLNERKKEKIRKLKNAYWVSKNYAKESAQRRFIQKCKKYK